VGLLARAQHPSREASFVLIDAMWLWFNAGRFDEWRFLPIYLRSHVDPLCFEHVASSLVET